MLVSLLDTQNFWVQFLSGLTVAGGGLWGIIRWIHNAMTKSVEERLVVRLEEIKAQTVPNHGGSLRDAIDRIEAKLDSAIRDIDRHLGYHRGLEDRG